MTRMKNEPKTELNAYFRPDGYSIGIIPEEQKDDENLDTDIKGWKEKFEEDKIHALFVLGFQVRKGWFSPSLDYLYHISEMLHKRLSMQPDIEFTREATEVLLTEEDMILLKEEVPFALGMEFVDSEWLMNLCERLTEVFQREIKAYEGTVAMYFTEYHSNFSVAGRVFFHLVENKDEQYPFAFMATYSTKPAKSRKTIHTPLKNALIEFKGDDLLLLSLLVTVTKAAQQSVFISDLLESGELFSPLKFTTKEAYTFLKETGIYEDAGIMCRIPDWWRKKSSTVKVTVTVGEKEPSKVGLEALMDFSPRLILGDEPMTKKELREFLAMAEGLIKYKGKWVEINHEKLSAALEVFDKVKDLAQSEDLTLGDAMRLELNASKVLNLKDEEVEVTVSNGQWLREVRDVLSNPMELKRVEKAPSFHASLRGYQEVGYQWLYRMSKMGFGACLADDMGLGKTVQMIAFLEYTRTTYGGKALLVLPASLIGNWQKEIEKFAPELPYQVLHKSAGKATQGIVINDASFLYITTYGMVSRMEELKETQWDFVILDEAQAIKNPGTKQTKQVKAIPARMRIAMTGTPIENQLGDLWSLFDFLNKGLLGTAKEFTDFSKGLADNTLGYAKLRKMISPFILRRLKTDKSIIADLPEKVEIIEHTALSKKQIALYQDLVREIGQKLEEAEGMGRRGLVLSSIMKFKQICNHPDLYLGREDFKREYSGKFEHLKEICETIYEKRESVLIFTQFREMTEPLSDFLKEIFHQEGFVLHGGTSIKGRNQMVEEFNSDNYVPYMVLSLKAGGVGLNLTAANHVIHFDRWWNPAVENQATDRAFRIGQKKNVMVHKFVSMGTIEEKIDAMITDKKNLAGDILSSGSEQWITEFSNKELMSLFTLGGEV